MRPLAAGSQGQDVLDAQCALTAAGFYHGDIDGDFGPAMDGAVRALQQARQLPVNGTVDAATAAALGLLEPAECDCALSGIPAEAIQARLFPGTPLANIQANLPHVLNSLVKFKLAYREMVLVALATLRAEAAVFLPVSERISKLNTTPAGKPFDRYSGILGNTGIDDAQKFRGRGFIQLTGRCNYAEYSRELFGDSRLVDNPLLLHQPAVAADVMASFLKDREPRMMAAIRANQMDRARELVNAGDIGIGSFTWAYAEGAGLPCMQQLPKTIIA